MSLSKQWKKLGELQRQVDQSVLAERELTEVELARRIGFLLVRGLDETDERFEVARSIAMILAQAPRLSPEQIEAMRVERLKAHLRHAV